MIITTWIMYIFARKGTGLSFPPKTSSDVEVVESEAVSVVQHWLKKTEEEASHNIKEKMSNNGPPTYGQNIHVTRDVMKHQLSKSDLLANQSQDVMEERTRIQFIRWSHTRIFQVPSEVRDEVMRDRIEQVRRSLGRQAMELRLLALKGCGSSFITAQHCQSPLCSPDAEVIFARHHQMAPCPRRKDFLRAKCLL
ncbi:spermatogenesis-associated protein 19, mitochondrial [Rhynchonycteris naso]